MVKLLSFITPIELTKINSPINGELKVVESLGRRILYASGDEQSGGTIIGMWGKSLRKLQNFKDSKFQKCLILGLGGGTVIKLLNKYFPRVKITAIEIDPVMIEIYKKYFENNSPKGVTIIQADAFSWVAKKRIEKFDLIIYDVYIGKFNPPKAVSIDFLTQLKRLLSSTGETLFNRHYQNDENDYQKFLQLCEKVFKKVELNLSYPYSRILLLR